MLTFSGMAAPTLPVSTPDKLPLALSPELWEALTPTQRELFQRADHLLDTFTFAPEVEQSLDDLVEKSGDDADDVLSALRLLDTMALVTHRIVRRRPDLLVARYAGRTRPHSRAR